LFNSKVNGRKLVFNTPLSKKLNPASNLTKKPNRKAFSVTKNDCNSFTGYLRNVRACCSQEANQAILRRP